MGKVGCKGRCSLPYSLALAVKGCRFFLHVPSPKFAQSGIKNSPVQISDGQLWSITPSHGRSPWRPGAVGGVRRRVLGRWGGGLGRAGYAFGSTASSVAAVVAPSLGRVDGVGWCGKWSWSCRCFDDGGSLVVSWRTRAGGVLVPRVT